MKLLAIGGILLLSLGLASCSDNNVYSTEAVLTYNDTTYSDTTTVTVADIVEDVYDSTVSITSIVDSYSYSSGSGVLVAYDDDLDLSYVLTCYHVVEDGTTYTVTLSDQETTLEAYLVGGDPATDIALLSISGTDYSYATISTADDLRLGDQIVIIGNPLGTLPGSVTSGYVSYLNRSVVSESYRTMQLIQTDATINSGNSGGGMFDMYGRLVGIVNAKYIDDGVEGLGFAIPISTAYDVMSSILETAEYQSGSWITKGYYVGSYEFAFSLTDYSGNIFGDTYVMVSSLSENSTTTGYSDFQSYDIITEVSYIDENNNQVSIEFSSSSSLLQQLYNLNFEIGDTIYFTIQRIQQSQQFGGGNYVSMTLEVEVTQFIHQ